MPAELSLSARLGRLSLRARLTLLAVGAAVLVLTAGALLLYLGLHAAIDDAVTSELRIRAEDVAAEVRRGEEPTLAGGLVTQVLTSTGAVLAPVGADPIVHPDELHAGRSEVVRDRAVEGVGSSARVLIRRVELAGGGERLIAVAGSTRPIQHAEGRLVLVLGIAGPATVAAVAAMAWILTAAALRPVVDMTRRARTISLRESDAQLPQPPGQDEIAELGATLNTMLTRIASTVAHERAFVDNASHELRTPLAVLRSELELARLEIDSGADAAATIAALDSALEETDRLVTLANRLLVLARADAGSVVGPAEVVLLREVVERVVEHLPEGHGVIEVDLGDAVVRADPIAVEQLVSNLVENAVRWAATRVRIDATTEHGAVALRISDDGPGFDPELLERAFDRFSRTGAERNSHRGGAGLGLAIVAAITNSLGGRVIVANDAPLGGSCVTVVLPSP